MHVEPDAVALLWTQTPRFIEIMKGGAGFQHPHYFFNQSDKLASLLDRIALNNIAYGTNEKYMQASQILTQLLDESRCYGGLTREQLRTFEPSVRAFIDKVQAVDSLAAEWDERMKQVSLKQPSKKRGRSDECEDEMPAPLKRRRDTCGSEMMDMDAGFNGSFPSPSPWVQNTSTQPIHWSGPYFD